MASSKPWAQLVSLVMRSRPWEIKRSASWTIRRLQYRSEVSEGDHVEVSPQDWQLQTRWNKDFWDLRLSHSELYDD